MSDPSISDIAKKAVGWSIFVSVLMIVVGILAIVLPYEAGLAANIFVAWMLIFAAVAHFVFAWYTRRTGNVLLKVLLGILYLCVAVYLLIEGVFEIVLFFQHRPAAGSGWFLMDGIVTLVLGGMIWATWPSSVEWVLGTLVGISIFFSGVTRLMISLAARRVVTKTA